MGRCDLDQDWAEPYLSNLRPVAYEPTSVPRSPWLGHALNKCPRSPAGTAPSSLVFTPVLVTKAARYVARRQLWATSPWWLDLRVPPWLPAVQCGTEAPGPERRFQSSNICPRPVFLAPRVPSRGGVVSLRGSESFLFLGPDSESGALHGVRGSVKTTPCPRPVATAGPTRVPSEPAWRRLPAPAQHWPCSGDVTMAFRPSVQLAKGVALSQTADRQESTARSLITAWTRLQCHTSPEVLLGPVVWDLISG